MDDPEETSSFLDSENAELKSMERNDTTESGKDTRTEVVCVLVLILKCSLSDGRVNCCQRDLPIAG